MLADEAELVSRLLQPLAEGPGSIAVQQAECVGRPQRGEDPGQSCRRPPRIVPRADESQDSIELGVERAGPGKHVLRGVPGSQTPEGAYDLRVSVGSADHH